MNSFELSSYCFFGYTPFIINKIKNYIIRTEELPINLKLYFKI